jgi:hypothetical protein
VESRTHLVGRLLSGLLSLGLLFLLLTLALLLSLDLGVDRGAARRTTATLGLAGSLLGRTESLDAWVERETGVDESAAARVVLLLSAVALGLVLLLLVTLLVTAVGSRNHQVSEQSQTRCES